MIYKKGLPANDNHFKCSPKLYDRRGNVLPGRGFDRETVEMLSSQNPRPCGRLCMLAVQRMYRVPSRSPENGQPPRLTTLISKVDFTIDECEPRIRR
jgi:hypothetical protein